LPLSPLSVLGNQARAISCQKQANKIYYSHMTEDSQLVQSQTYWHEQVEACRARVDRARGELIEAEAALAERLAAINLFEFRLRSHVGGLANRLDALEREIKALRQKIRDIADNWGDFDDDGRDGVMDDARGVFSEGGSARHGDYRYMGETPTAAPQDLDAGESAEIKRLYRGLARRFHPDMGIDEADRDYRTQIMMAINAAYAANDLQRLRDLALEPDSGAGDNSGHSDEQQVELLRRELLRLERRLKEVRRELAALEEHKSARLMRRAQRAGAEGRDFFAELAAQMKREVARKMVERDVLHSDIENLLAEEGDLRGAGDLRGDELAENVWLWSLDNAFEEDPLADMETWLHRRRDRFYWDEDDILDDGD
jgi:DNA repair exonuclease SbcCD ATPase subunit